MILTPLPLDNPWKRGAIGFFIFNMASTVMIWIIFDSKGFSKDFLEKIFLSIPAVSVILFFLGTIFSVVNRTKFFVLILGVFGVLPILISCMLPFFLYVLISSFSIVINFIFIVTYIVASALWISWSIKKTAEVERKFDYVRSQISDGVNKKTINRKKLQSFSGLNRNKKNKKINFLKFIIFPLSFIGYPLQRILSSLGGDAAVLGFVSILSLPLSIYFMGNIASGYYLWVYSIGKLEREYKSKITM